MSDKKESQDGATTQASKEEYHRGIVLYSDGGSRPNPGYAGWGAHGYLYSTEPSNKGPGLIKQLITPQGYVHNVADAKTKNTIVQPVEYFDFFGTSGNNTSNNAAEVDALRYSLNKLKTYDVKKIQVFTDSEYLRRGITEWVDTWKAKGWQRDDGTMIANAANWKGLVEELDVVRNNGIDVSIKWVKGHSDNFGNTIADKLATIGVLHSMNEQPRGECSVSPAQGYWKADIDRHPFIHFKRLYFNSVPEHNIPGHYYLAEPGTDDFLIAKKTPDSAYCVVRLKKEDYAIETVKSRQYEISNLINAVIMLRLDKLYHPDVHKYIDLHGKYTLMQPNKNTLSLNFVDNKPVTIEMNPPGLCLRAIENFHHLDELLDKFIHRDTKDKDWQARTNFKVHDITDRFYDTVEKTVKKEVVKKFVLKPEFGVGAKSLTVSVTIPVNGQDKEVKIPMVLGLDVAPRNSLKHIEELNPKINLITWHDSENSVRYASVIEIDSGIGIWSNYFADRLLLN